MFKDASLSRIGVFVSLIFCITNLGLLIILEQFFDHKLSVLVYIITFFATLFVCFFTVRFLIERYLLRKIKLIYKIINSSKTEVKEDIKLDETMSFEMVESDVAKWAASTQDQIKTLKSLETYRKNYVGNISHELKTPIFSIQGFLHTLLDGAMYDENINRKYLERAAVNVDRLQTIIEDLEIINRLEEGITQLDQEVFNVQELCNEAIKELELKAQQEEIRVIVKKSDLEKFDVIADRNSMYQVFINLLSNSIKYGKKDGLTKVGFYDMDDRILVEVSDNGIGIEEQHLKHLFDRFYRVDSSRSREMGGSGLGLAIVKHIMEAHKQTINVRSKVNVGSTFGFTIAKA